MFGIDVYQEVVEKLLAERFPTVACSMWEAYQKSFKREYKDLLLEKRNSLPDGFRPRIIAVLLTPCEKFRPLHWCHCRGFLADIPAAELEGFFEGLRPREIAFSLEMLRLSHTTAWGDRDATLYHRCCAQYGSLLRQARTISAQYPSLTQVVERPEIERLAFQASFA